MMNSNAAAVVACSSSLLVRALHWVPASPNKVCTSTQSRELPPQAGPLAFSIPVVTATPHATAHAKPERSHGADSSSLSISTTLVAAAAATFACATRVNARRSKLVRKASTVLQPGEKVVGIDLGTTNSVIAAVEAGEPKVLLNHEGERSTPSIVAWTKDGELLVGRSAKRQAVMNPDNTFYSVKRFVGREYEEVEADEIELFPYKVLREKGKVELECPVLDKNLSPEEVSAHILKKLRTDAAEFLHAQVDKAVITVPAYFNDAQRQATKDAGRIAGLEVLRIASEPTMAALAYGLDRKNWSVLMVVDLGGGTFDVSIMEVGDGVLEVTATAGDTQLGGNDFDRRIVNWMLSEFYNEHGINLREDSQAMQRLQEAAELAKTELSSCKETRISVPFIAAGADGPLHIDAMLGQDAFEEMCGELIDRLRLPILQALTDGRIRKRGVGSIAEVVLVGGASRIPAVARVTEELVGFKSTNAAINPEEVVAIGAAVQAAMIAGEVSDIMLIDVTPLTLGVETDGGIVSTVVEKNTAIPCKRCRFFTTTEDGQDEIEVNVLQGERPLAKDNKLLGSFRLSNLPPAPAGVAKLEVQFEITLDGVMKVSAKDWATRMEHAITVNGASNLRDDEIALMETAAEVNWESDEQKKERLELRYKAKELLKTAQHHLDELGSKAPEDQRQQALWKSNILKSALERLPESADHAPIKAAFQDLEYEMMMLGQRIYGKQVAPDNRPGPARPRPPGGVAGGGSADV